MATQTDAIEDVLAGRTLRATAHDLAGEHADLRIGGELPQFDEWRAAKGVIADSNERAIERVVSDR